MSYASISEAWGSVSGSNMLNTSVPPNPFNNSQLTNSIHPAHQQRIENFSNTGTAGNMKQQYQNNNSNQNMQHQIPNFNQMTQSGTPPGPGPLMGPNQPQNSTTPYMCNYGDMSCAQAYHNNQVYNNMKRQVAAGMQPFTPWSPPPQNYMFSPQYPWYNNARNGYLQYGGDISSMWYNQPWVFYPDIAQQVQNYQQNHPGDYRVPIERPYRPPSYGKFYEQGLRRRNREYFGDLNINSESSVMIRNCLIIFIFFLLAISTLLVTFVIAMKAGSASSAASF